MPGTDIAYPPRPSDEALFPPDEAAHAELLGWCMSAWNAAESAKRVREDKWRKFHRVYRAWVETQEVPDWRSNLSIPYTFSIIESIVPKMVAQLPGFVCLPVGPEDVAPAKLMENRLENAADVSELYVELIKAIKTSLKFGSGILKNYFKQDIRRAYERVPKMEMVDLGGLEPVTDADGLPSTDMDGNAQMTQVENMQEQPVIDPATGQPVMT